MRIITKNYICHQIRPGTNITFNETMVSFLRATGKLPSSDDVVIISIRDIKRIEP